MAYPRLDATSQKAKRQSAALFVISIGGCLFGSSLVRAMDGPRWLAIGVGLLSIAGLGLAIYRARGVRCPSCAQSIYYRPSPTWVRPPKKHGEPDLLSCPHCYEEIDVSRGTSPPSNISLQADRER
jgi:hypothetical protein